MPDQSIDDIYVEVRLAQEQLRKDMRQAQIDSEKSSKGIENTYKKTKPSINTQKIKKDFNEIDKRVTKSEGRFNKFFKTIAIGVTGFLGFRAAINFGRKILNTASEFEQLRVRLTSLYGSAEKATDVFNQFKKIAATTPFTLKEVVEAGSTLKAFGLNAENTLKSVTDLAAYMGLNVVEAASAVGRAFAGGVGAADVLRERGVLNLIKSFKGIEDLTKLTLPEFRKALLEAMVDPVAGIVGSTDRMSKSFQGAVSNMGDALDNFSASLGGGALSGLKNLVRQATALLTALTPTTTALDEAKTKAFELSYNFDNLTSTYLRLKTQTSLTEEETNLFKETIRDLQSQYPNYLKNIDLNKSKLEDVETALSNARMELDKFIESILAQAVISKYKDDIADWSEEIYKSTKILNGLKNQLEETNKTGLDPFGKLTPDQRNKLIEQGDLTTIFRTANIFTPLEDQIKNLDKRIEELRNKRNEIGEIAKSMVTSIQGVTAPKTESPPTEEMTIIDIDKILEKIGTEIQLKELTYKLTNDILQSAKDTLTAQLALLEKEKDSTENQKKKVELLKAINDLTEKQKDLTFEFEPAIDTEADDKENADAALKRAQERQEKEKQAAQTIRELKLNAIDDEFEKRKEIIELEREDALKNLYDLGLTEAEIKAAQNDIDKKYENDLADLTTQKFNAGLSAARSISSAISNIVGSGNAFVDALNTALSIAEAIAAAIEAVKVISSIFTGGASLVAKTGGEFAHGQKIASYNQIPKFASGGEFNVPSKYTNDSFLMRVSGDEKVRVTPANQVGNTDKILSRIEGRLAALNQTVSNLETRVDIVNNAPDVQTTVRKYKQVENNLIRQGVKFNES